MRRDSSVCVCGDAAQTHIIWSCLSDLHQLLAVQTTFLLHVKAIQFEKPAETFRPRACWHSQTENGTALTIAQAPGAQPPQRVPQMAHTSCCSSGTDWSSSSTTWEHTNASALGAQARVGPHQGLEQLCQAE